MKDIVAEVRRNLEALGTPERAAYEKNYHKSSLHFLGANVPSMNKEGKRLAKEHPIKSRIELLALESEFWASGVHELHGMACALMTKHVGLLEKDDLRLLRARIKDAAGWAHVDTLAPWSVGPLVVRLGLWDELDQWAKDDDFWVRRAAMLALLVPLRSGDLGQWDRFTRYAASMIEENEFFIRKAIGWVLREVSKKNPQPVYEFLKANRNKASGLTKREGGKYLAPEMRAELGLE